MMAKSPTSILFTLVAIAATSSVVQCNPLVENVVGGTQSTEGDYPYFVEMGGCGGSLVAPDVVLFAAHCLDWTDKQVIIGAYKKRTIIGDGEQRFCDEWIADPDYGIGDSSNNNDFALCKLNEPVIIDESKIKLVMNEVETVPADGDNLIVMGLGALSQGGNGPDYIHNVTVPTISTQDCNAPTSYGGLVKDSMLCAGFTDGGKDSCQGDSGGPIVKREYQGDGTFIDVQVGVVSWGSGCAQANYPGVYSRVSHRYTWIRDTICDEFNSIASFCYDGTPPPTNAPAPCAQDLAVNLTTDLYAYETTWTLTKDSTDDELMKRKYLVNSYETISSVCLEASTSVSTCYTFDIMDSYGDGMCTSAGCGSYSLTLNGIVVAEGNGQFTSQETKTFCIDSIPNTPSPTTKPPSASPTKSPSESPTESPSEPPTESPIEPLTEPPSASPTKFPSESPSESPSATQENESPTPIPTESCVDDAAFRYQNKPQKDCSWVGRGGSPSRVRNKCKRKGPNKNKVFELCPETCGKIAGIGRCAFLAN